MHLLKSRKQINMISKATLSLLVITTAVYAQAPCSFPAQWEATEGVLSGSSNDEGNTAITMGQIAVSFDGKGKMIYMDETIVTGNMTKMYTILQFYNDSVQYFIENTTCTRSKLGPWADRDRVPDDAKVVRQYSLGQNQSIMVTDYSFNVGQLTIVLSVTNDMCFPLIEEQFGQIQGVNVLTAVGIQSPTLGIKNPTVFNIPDICKKDNVVEVDWVERRIPFTR